MPRCGNPDRIVGVRAGQLESGRKKRHTFWHRLWDRSDFTWRIENLPKKFDGTREEAKAEIRKAFNVWSGVAKINLVEKSEGKVDIPIRFLTGAHDDCDKPFEKNVATTLAHAAFPRSLKGIHYDDNLHWTIGDGKSKYDLFQVTVHELAHSFGIDHSKDSGAFITPVYRYWKKFELHSDDLRAIHELFGPKTSKPSDEPPNLCSNSAFDAITRVEDGSTYIFKDEYYWLLTEDGLAKESPARIEADWAGLPGSLDAAATLADGKTYFFKGDQCWAFRNKQLEEGYPREIGNVFPGIPGNIDAAFVWAETNGLYFFKGDNYWKFTGKVDKEYPLSVTKTWIGVPANLSDVFTWQDKRTYFFKGNQYYRFNNDEIQVSCSRTFFSFQLPTNYYYEIQQALLKSLLP